MLTAHNLLNPNVFEVDNLINIDSTSYLLLSFTTEGFRSFEISLSLLRHQNPDIYDLILVSEVQTQWFRVTFLTLIRVVPLGLLFVVLLILGNTLKILTD